ncbi:MAG TPA: hypothetical protein VFS05_09065 [Gemmatimonadaceae bacterium]|nr:hypothetical protein [Gemmatimonadaceae bacterium]
MTVPTPVDTELHLHDAPGTLRFPVGWLLERAAPPIQYRAAVDVAGLTVESAKLSVLPHSYPPALALAVRQGSDGTWNRAMLAPPASRGDPFDSVGTVPALRRLLEYGWEVDSPPILHARRPLFRLLAEDADPAFAYELAPADRGDVEGARRARTTLREAAAAALAQAGHEKDPRVRGAAARIARRLEAFLGSPLAESPFVRAGGAQVLHDEACPPTLHSLLMLAHMPLFQREWAELLDALASYLGRPAPRHAPAVLAGRVVVPMPHVVLGDPLAGAATAEGDLPFTLAWLELVARLGLLRQGTAWSAAFERLLDECDAEGVWRPRKGESVSRSTDPFVWPSWTLEGQLSGDARYTDVTFRLGLIGRLAGWQVELA